MDMFCGADMQKDTWLSAFNSVAINPDGVNVPVHVDVDMEGLLEKVSAQNFVPVIDDEKVFIGIITRRDVIHYLAKQCRSREEAAV